MRIIVALLCALVLIVGNEGKSQPMLSKAVGVNGWTIISNGVQVFMQGGPPLYFDFPTNGSAHYVYKSGSVQPGQTITLKFSIEGAGSLVQVDPADVPPATVSLFVMSDPSEASMDRWWWPIKTKLRASGDYEISVELSDKWIGVYGAPGLPTGIRYVGFTFGGEYFAGHGVRVNGGPVRFVLKEYSVK